MSYDNTLQNEVASNESTLLLCDQPMTNLFQV
jgi:hypothetical protein